MTLKEGSKRAENDASLLDELGVTAEHYEDPRVGRAYERMLTRRALGAHGQTRRRTDSTLHCAGRGRLERTYITSGAHVRPWDGENRWDGPEWEGGRKRRLPQASGRVTARGSWNADFGIDWRPVTGAIERLRAPRERRWKAIDDLTLSASGLAEQYARIAAAVSPRGQSRRTMRRDWTGVENDYQD